MIAKQQHFNHSVTLLRVVKSFFCQLRVFHLLGVVVALVLTFPAEAYASGEQLLYFVAGLTGLYQVFVMWALLQSKRLNGRRLVAGALYLAILSLIWIFLLSEQGGGARHGTPYAVLVWGAPLFVSWAIYMTLKRKPQVPHQPAQQNRENRDRLDFR